MSKGVVVQYVCVCARATKTVYCRQRLVNLINNKFFHWSNVLSRVTYFS